MVGCSTYVIDVACTQTFLAGGGSGEFEFHFAKKVILKLVHAGRREENRRIPGWYEHVTRLTTVTLRLEEGEVFLA
jgi:hypothetical protein